MAVKASAEEPHLAGVASLVQNIVEEQESSRDHSGRAVRESHSTPGKGRRMCTHTLIGTGSRFVCSIV